MMTLDQMIAALEEAREEMGGGAEVRIAHQPEYPIALAAEGVRTVRDVDDEDQAEEAAADGHDRFAWIATEPPRDDASPYAPRWAWQQDGGW
ncbi:MAG: hypothetical protein FWE15_20095 [Actinomycetia bacterium]|nr:hypothetical protein [Actinomycetes bacterium]